mgnify:CR=1 FL=1
MVRNIGGDEHQNKTMNRNEKSPNRVFVDKFGDKYVLYDRCPITIRDFVYIYGYRDSDGLKVYYEKSSCELVFTGVEVSDHYMSILIGLSNIKSKEGNLGMIIDRYGMRFYYGPEKFILFDHLGDKP